MSDDVRGDSNPRNVNAVTPPITGADPFALTSTVLNRAKSAAAAKGLAPGMKARGARKTRSGPDAKFSGAGISDRDPQLLNFELDRLLRDRGWDVDVSVGSIMGRWREIVGDEVADHVEPYAFDDGRLKVRADSTVWAQQLRVLRPQLLGRLAAELGEGIVTDVDVEGPTGRSFKRGPRSVQGRGPRDTWG